MIPMHSPGTVSSVTVGSKAALVFGGGCYPPTQTSQFPGWVMSVITGVKAALVFAAG
jgi:hypothetical protein